jgi:hypothetical protein
MTAFPDHYAALGIDPSADQEVIAAAYRALAKKYHPDTGATTGTASADRFAAIQQAYEVLGSPEGRSRYDLELLDVTQRELDEHLARKQRKITAATGAPPPPSPDLGNIRPERRSGKTGARRFAISLKDMGPFLVVSGLLMAVAGGTASLYLSNAPGSPAAEPPPPQVAQPEPAPKAKPAAQPQQQAALPQTPPLFGTSMLDEPAPDASPLPPEEDVAAEPASAPSVPVPIPKARPQVIASAEPAPVQAEARARRFAVVIYEKYRSGDTIQEDGRVVFASETRCAAFGERAVLRRLAPFEGQRQRPRIWYECVEAP